jgi:hypothetical protein
VVRQVKLALGPGATPQAIGVFGVSHKIICRRRRQETFIDQEFWRKRAPYVGSYRSCLFRRAQCRLQRLQVLFLD